MISSKRRRTLPVPAALIAVGLLASDSMAQDRPPMGQYEIRHCQMSQRANIRPVCSVQFYMTLHSNGTYEVYWAPSKELRSRGTYTYDAASRRMRWLSGVNYDMGRGGSFEEHSVPFDCRPCLLLGPLTVAVPVP